MDLGGYANIPESLPEAQQMIVCLLDEQKRDAQLQAKSLGDLNQAMAMIEAARKALNAIEAPPEA